MATRYAEYTDFLVYGLRPQALGTAVQTDVEAELDAASAVIDDHIAGRYNLPLLAWSKSITITCCAIAAYLLLVSPRGYNPGAGADQNIRDRYMDAVRAEDGNEGTLVRIQRRTLHPVVTESPKLDALAQPYVITSSVVDDNGRVCRNRGW